MDVGVETGGGDGSETGSVVEEDGKQTLMTGSLTPDSREEDERNKNVWHSSTSEENNFLDVISSEKPGHFSQCLYFAND